MKSQNWHECERGYIYLLCCLCNILKFRRVVPFVDRKSFGALVAEF